MDNILSLLKLDSALIAILPTSFRSESVKEEAMRMFKAEFASNGIDVETVIDDMEHAMTDYLVGDSSRVMQVLVNLLTNAIKFTRTEPVRKMQICYGAANAAPLASKFGDGFAWSTTQHTDPTLNSEYGTGRFCTCTSQ